LSKSAIALNKEIGTNFCAQQIFALQKFLLLWVEVMRGSPHGIFLQLLSQMLYSTS